MAHEPTTPIVTSDAILASVGQHHSRTGALALAATEVVVRRMQLGGAALVSPATADHAEFARMVPEKAKAFAGAGAAMLDQGARIGREMAGYALDEVAIAGRAASRILASRSPAALLAAQAEATRDWFSQWLARSGALVRLTLDAQAVVMTPIHQAAHANVTRLRR